jgi:hypothetical protein
MEAAIEIDTAVWPMLKDFTAVLAPYCTSVAVPKKPGHTVEVVELGVIRKRYEDWRRQYEQSIALSDELLFDRDQLALKLKAALVPHPPQRIVIHAPPRISNNHLVDYKPTIFTGAKDFETVVTFLGEVEHYVEHGGGAFPERLTDPEGHLYELPLDDKLVDTLWRYVNREVLDWFKLATNIVRLPPPNYAYQISWK